MITQGPVASVRVQTGENLIGNIEVNVENGLLAVKAKPRAIGFAIMEILLYL